MNQVSNQERPSVISHEEKAHNKDKHFIDDDMFQAILAIREEVYQATEVNVTPRKLVNMLIRQADFNLLRDQLIKQYS